MNPVLDFEKKPIPIIPSRTLSFRSTASNLVLIILLVLVAGCSVASNPQATPTPIPTPLIPIKPVYVVQRGEIADYARFTGRIAPVQEVELAFGKTGRVDQVLVKTGDTVQSGDLLAILETGDQAYNLRRAQIQVDLAQLDLDLARQQMPVARQTYSMTLSMKEYQLEQSQMEMERLRAAGYTGANLRQAEINLELAQQELELARQQVALDIAGDEADLVRKERQLELAQIDLTELETSIAGSQILAPFAGIVVSMYLKEDTMAEAYRTAILLADVQNMVIRAKPGDSDLQRLEEGMPVTVSPIGRPDTVLAGSIQSMPYPYGSGGSDQEEVFIALENDLSPNQYNLGDLMEINVLIAHKSDILWLPPQAIRTFEGRKFVVVQEGDGQRRVDVKIGIQAEDRVEILEGLEEGQTVLSP